MRWSLWIMSALAALSVVCAQEASPVVEATGAQFCTSSMEVLLKEIGLLFSSDEYNVTINCLAFSSERTLEGGVISVFPIDGATPGRYNLTCQSNALQARELIGLNASNFDIRDTNYRACVKCRPTEVDREICDRPCPTQCERCAEFGTGILCTECTRYRLLNSYPPRRTPGAEEILAERRRFAELGQEEECEDFPRPNPEMPENFHCVEQCPDLGNHSKVSKEDGKTCFACGLEYCAICEQNEQPGGRDECRECMENTVLFDGHCYACPLALIARTAIVQKAEEANEQRAIQITQIELAVSLPVVCVLVIIFFMLMSVYAHHRYPHISHRGHKRHRKKPDLFSKESSSPAPSAEEDFPPLPESGVWRAHPSIRFR